jgi:hypothetical protein
MELKWKFQANAGTTLHYVLQQYFTKDENGQLLGDKSKDEILNYITSNIKKNISD